MEVFHGAFNNIFFLEILLLVLGFVLWRGKPCSSSTGMKTLQCFEMVFGLGTRCVFGHLYILICTQKFPDSLVIQKPLIKLSVSGVLSLLFQKNRYLPLKAEDQGTWK